VHWACGGDDVALASLALPALAVGMTHGKVVRWLAGPGEHVPKGGAIAEVRRRRRGGGVWVRAECQSLF
jgi:hypothetical protein